MSQKTIGLYSNELNCQKSKMILLYANLNITGLIFSGPRTNIDQVFIVHVHPSYFITFVMSLH